jgi:hypothetical protein
VSKQILRTVGRCIYCDSTNGLSEEHIIPFGLGADWILKDASCERHRKITSRFELDVLRNLCGPLRAALNVRSRRGHENRRYPVTITHQDDTVETVEIDPRRFAAPMHYIALPVPRSLLSKLAAIRRPERWIQTT